MLNQVRRASAFGTPNKVAKSMSSPVSVPTAHPIEYNHDGIVQGDSVVPTIGKQYQILAKNTVPTTAWNGSLGQVEYEFPAFLGKITDNVLKFNITVSATGAGNVALSPTPFWFSRIEILYNSQVVESVEPYDAATETVSYLTDQEFKNVYQTMNYGSDGGLASAVAYTANSSQTFNYYLPLWASFLNCQPFIKGFKDAWRIRFTFANSIIATVTPTGSALTTATGVSVALNQMYLYTTEAQVSDAATAGLEAAHRSGIIYRSIIRNKFSANEATIAAGAVYNKVLTTFSTDSAGLLLYVSLSSTSEPGYCLNTYALDSLELRDAANAQLTITLPAGLVESYLMTQQTPLNSAIVNNSLYNIYLFSFCNNILNVLETGKNSGGLKLTSQERIQFVNPAGSALASVKVNVISYEYALMAVRGGVATVTRQA